MEKITMQTIANHIGVSKMTVSRYFNGGYVSSENREKIEIFVKEKNYTPNFLARNLKQKSNIIGIVAPKIDNHVFNELVRGFISEAMNSSMQLLYFSTNYDSQLEDDAIKSLISMNAKGIIIDSNSITIQKKNLHNVDNIISFGLKSEFKTHVYFPEKQAFKAILPQKSDINVKFVYRDAMLSTRTTIATETLSNELGFELIEEQDIANHLLANTLYICSTDEVAYTVYRAINNSEFVIGSDIFVIGIGGNNLNDLLSPSLASIHFPYETLAQEMISMVVNDCYSSKCSSFEIISGNSYPDSLYK